jgi:hypothetical protein
MTASASQSRNILRISLEFITLVAGSILAGFVIGTLQHYVGFGVWGYGFSKGAFSLALIEGGGVGAAFAVPTGLIAYYGVLKRHVTNRQIAVVVLGSLAGGCLTGAIISWPSAFLTPLLTIALSRYVRVAPRSLVGSSTPGSSTMR